jgi:hypothetical protein
MKPDGTLTTTDVRDFAGIWIRGARILYAVMYNGRTLTIEEWSKDKGMHPPPELAMDNVVSGMAATPRFVRRADTGQIRLYWTAPDANTHWTLRYKDLPFYAD